MIMPSAATVKIEKNIASSDNGLMDNSSGSPLRQAITIIEHKIRNLEKRKSKLETYRQKFSKEHGKELNADQKTAIAKYDEVTQTLDFARDLNKQFLGIALHSEKEEKKKARKEANARSQAEINKVREVLLIQDALSNMDETVRKDFLHGRNGAAQLSEADLKLLDDYYNVITPKHEAGDPTAFMPQVQAAAEHLLAVVDGKPKEIFGTTYSQVKDVIGKIHESGYLDQAPVEESDQQMIDDPAIVSAVKSQEVPVTLENAVTSVPPQETNIAIVEHNNVTLETDIRPPPMVPVPQQQANNQPAPIPPMEPVPIQQQQQQPPLPEQVFYQQPPPPPPPQARPITEVIGSGSFFFLQDSELDTPPEQIPSQTFTNQTFVAAPPPPIPMPSHFAPYPTAPPPPQPLQPTAPPQIQVPPTAVANNPMGLSSNPITTNSIPPQSKNGIGDHLPDANHEEVPAHRGNRHPQRSNITTHHQPFFANNNGFNNRPSRNRNNGPRLTNRHNQ